MTSVPSMAGHVTFIGAFIIEDDITYFAHVFFLIGIVCHYVFTEISFTFEIFSTFIARVTVFAFIAFVFRML